jgi:hypothetical protein
LLKSVWLDGDISVLYSEDVFSLRKLDPNGDICCRSTGRYSALKRHGNDPDVVFICYVVGDVTILDNPRDVVRSYETSVSYHILHYLILFPIGVRMCVPSVRTHITMYTLCATVLVFK